MVVEAQRDAPRDPVRSLALLAKRRPDALALAEQVGVGELARVEAEIREAIGRDGRLTLPGLRDRLGISRREAKAFLDYFDAAGVTRRRPDDSRVLRNRPDGVPRDRRPRVRKLIAAAAGIGALAVLAGPGAQTLAARPIGGPSRALSPTARALAASARATRPGTVTEIPLGSIAQIDPARSTSSGRSKRPSPCTTTPPACASAWAKSRRPRSSIGPSSVSNQTTRRPSSGSRRSAGSRSAGGSPTSSISGPAAPRRRCPTA